MYRIAAQDDDDDGEAAMSDDDVDEERGDEQGEEGNMADVVVVNDGRDSSRGGEKTGSSSISTSIDFRVRHCNSHPH